MSATRVTLPVTMSLWGDLEHSPSLARCSALLETGTPELHESPELLLSAIVRDTSEVLEWELGRDPFVFLSFFKGRECSLGDVCPAPTSSPLMRSIYLGRKESHLGNFCRAELTSGS